MGEEVQKYIDSGVASVRENPDGSKEISYKGIRRGRHLALGDLQRCAMHVLRYLLKSSAWKEMKKNMK